MTDHAAQIQAAEAELAAARAEVSRLQAKLADQLAERAAVHGAAAGRAEAQRRYPKAMTTAPAATVPAGDTSRPDIPRRDTSAADGRSEAARRFRREP